MCTAKERLEHGKMENEHYGNVRHSEESSVLNGPLSVRYSML